MSKPIKAQMSTSTNTIDSLGKQLANDALTCLIRIYPRVSTESAERIDAACAAMRAVSKTVLNQLLDDARDAPGVELVAYQIAVLTLAHEGIKSLKAA